MRKRILFLGERRIADMALELFFDKPLKEKFELKGVVVDNILRAKYRKLCKLNDIQIISNEARSEKLILNLIEKEEIECLISVQHPWILSSNVLESVSGRAFNLHNARLPNYKGYNSISHEILSGELYHATTIHWISEKVDEGDIAFEESIRFNESDTALSMYQKSLGVGLDVFKKFMQALDGNDVPRITKKSGGVFYDRNSINTVSCLDKFLDTEKIAVRARAAYFPPYNFAYFTHKNEKYAVVPLREVRAFLEQKPKANLPQNRDDSI